MISTLLAACASFSAVGAAPSGSPRQALLIGNAAYPDGDAELSTPANDADKLSDTLQRLGFETEVEKNLGKKDLNNAIERFLQRLDAGSTAVLFFAGFGVQAGGKNYLIPIDAHIWSEDDAASQGVSLDGVLAKIAARGVKTRIVLVDASRRNPFDARFRSVPPGLAAPTSSAGTLGFYSAIGAIANDPSPSARNSLFVNEIVRQIGDAERNVAQALAAARDEIARQSKGQPAPLLDNGLEAPVWLDGNRRTSVAEAPKSLSKAALKTPEPAKNSEPVKALEPVKTPETPKISELRLTPDRPKLGPASPSAPIAEHKPLEVKAYLPSELELKTDLDARIARNPSDESSISRRGQLLALHRDYPAALADFERSTRLNPDNIDSWNNRCWIRAIVNDLPRALQDCNEALRRRPNFADALDSRGLVRFKQGDLNGAIEDYNEALKHNARHASSLYGRGLSRLRLGQADKADEDMAKARSINPTIESDYREYGLD
ncbi:caspase family protein [Methylosinus sp. Sm6]|uniref:caspase family protein n=1 Tax=Methylosinus sp. Sm6 TaxID=2866948 RepID=UPI001C98F8C5